jgi:alkaline phosphatase
MRSTVSGASLAAVILAAAPCAASAQTIYPIDRADILSGAKFDFKVEFPGVVDPSKLSVTVNGKPYADVLGRPGEFVEREGGKDQSALVLRGVTLTDPGDVKVVADSGTGSASVSWHVFDTPSPRKAKNVILFIGDGMSNAHRVAARVLSRQISQGKYKGRLVIDDFGQTALVGTSGVDSLMTDSANSMTAYTTGHKSSTNALGVYADRTPDTQDDPRVETIGEIAKRKGLAVGIVTNTEVEDATPAGVAAHTRRRSEYDLIVQQFYALQPEVLMGGGSANFIPKTAPGSKRSDEQDFVAKFREAGYAVATTSAELKDAGPGATKLLGLYNLGNLDGVLDRRFLKGGSVKRFPDQPDLTAEVSAALQVLSKSENGFFLMVESGLIDKYTHALDMERAMYDTIMLDNAVGVAKAFADQRNDTLILVLADHTHPVGIVGVMNDDMNGPVANTLMRDRLGVYNEAGYPNYPAPDAEGYPDRVDVSKRIAMFSAGFPDYYETFRPKLQNPMNPTVAGEEKGVYVANPVYAKEPGAVFREGNLPRSANSDIHSAEDSLLNAYGPGSEMVKGFMDNTDVFKVMAHALALGTR